MVEDRPSVCYDYLMERGQMKAALIGVERLTP
jgi:hypothetical protein